MAIRSELPKVPFHKSLVRVILLKGGDRLLMIGSVALSTYLGFASFVAWGPIVGPVIGLAVLSVLIKLVVRMTKNDERMREVFLRARKYKGFYPARGHSKGSRSYPGWTK